MLMIREEQPGDLASIDRVNERAFDQPQEAALINALRAGGGVTLSLVALENSTIIAHILFSPVTIRSETDTFEAVGLGPMAVDPDRQRRGIGSQLVHAALDRLRAAGHALVVVLGHPEYYPRFGFRRASEFGIRWEHDAPDAAFMVLELIPGGLSGSPTTGAGPSGTVCYRPEFDGLE